MPPLRDTDFTDLMRTAAAKLGWNPHRSPAADQFAAVRRPLRLRLSRLLRHRRMPRQRQEFDCGHDHPRRAEDQKPDNLRKRPGDAHPRRQQRQSHRRAIPARRPENISSPPRSSCSASYTYENVRLLLLSKSKAFPNGLSNNHGQVGKHYIGHWDARECIRRCSPST